MEDKAWAEYLLGLLKTTDHSTLYNFVTLRPYHPPSQPSPGSYGNVSNGVRTSRLFVFDVQYFQSMISRGFWNIQHLKSQDENVDEHMSYENSMSQKLKDGVAKRHHKVYDNTKKGENMNRHRKILN
jgi:hypothetical protein